MKIEYGSKYKNSLKNIKKRHKESNTLEMVLNHIRQCIDFNELSRSPISQMYEYEALKYELNGYHSFNLNKNGGKIRLIFSTDNHQTIILEFISIKTNMVDDTKETNND